MVFIGIYDLINWKQVRKKKPTNLTLFHAGFSSSKIRWWKKNKIFANHNKQDNLINKRTRYSWIYFQVMFAKTHSTRVKANDRRSKLIALSYLHQHIDDKLSI